MKYHSWYLCQISLQIMLLPILIYNFTFEIINKTKNRRKQKQIFDSQIIEFNNVVSNPINFLKNWLSLLARSRKISEKFTFLFSSAASEDVGTSLKDGFKLKHLLYRYVVKLGKQEYPRTPPKQTVKTGKR